MIGMTDGPNGSGGIVDAVSRVYLVWEAICHYLSERDLLSLSFTCKKLRAMIRPSLVGMARKMAARLVNDFDRLCLVLKSTDSYLELDRATYGFYTTVRFFVPGKENADRANVIKDYLIRAENYEVKKVDAQKFVSVRSPFLSCQSLTGHTVVQFVLQGAESVPLGIV